MKIVEFAFIVYPSTNSARSRAFYESVIGLTSTTLVERGGQFWIESEVGPHTLGLGNEPFLKPGCRGAIVVDPDGNKLGIHKRKAR